MEFASAMGPAERDLNAFLVAVVTAPELPHPLHLGIWLIDGKPFERLCAQGDHIDAIPLVEKQVAQEGIEASAGFLWPRFVAQGFVRDGAEPEYMGIFGSLLRGLDGGIAAQIRTQDGSYPLTGGADEGPARAGFRPARIAPHDADPCVTRTQAEDGHARVPGAIKIGRPVDVHQAICQRLKLS
jgi:hypothetical protein